jgi:hypothetical protein
MYFDSSDPSEKIGYQPPPNFKIMLPQPARDPVTNKCMHSGIAQQDLPRASGGGIFFQGNGNIFLDLFDHGQSIQ